MGPLSDVAIWKILLRFGDDDLVIWTANSASMYLRASYGGLLERVGRKLTALQRHRIVYVLSTCESFIIIVIVIVIIIIIIITNDNNNNNNNNIIIIIIISIIIIIINYYHYYSLLLLSLLSCWVFFIIIIIVINIITNGYIYMIQIVMYFIWVRRHADCLRQP